MAKKSAFNKASGHTKPKVHRNYTNKELITRIDNYTKVAKTEKKKKDMIDMKDEYIKKEQEKPGNRFARNLHYQRGIKANIHPRETIENLEKQDKEQDQRDRNRSVKKAKTYYHKNYSLTKLHKEAVQKTKTRSKDISKDRG